MGLPPRRYWHSLPVRQQAMRRQAQALYRRPDLALVTFRGNVDTRLAKLEAGEVTIRRAPANVESAAREVLEMFALQAGAKAVDLRFEAAVGLPKSLLVDEDRLRQILINLVGNAVKFTERGRVTLALSYGADETAAEVYPRFRAAQEQSPLALGPFGPELLSYHLVRSVLRDERFQPPPGIVLQAQGITSGPLWDKVMNSLLCVEGDTHRRLRGMCSSAA